MDEVLVGIVAAVMLMIALLGGSYFGNSLSCDSRWYRSGMNSEYGFFTGCVVQREDGTWVPENVLRDIQ